jgi:hypothetical protein
MGQKAPSSPAKFVLVTLADTASAGDWLAWPSVAYLSETTQQDRKTVLSNLKKLELASLIAEAGRTGRTGQVTVWRLPVVTPGKSPKSGTLSTPPTVPDFLGNSTVFPLKESQKRDTEPVIEPVIEPEKGNRTPEAVKPTARKTPELTFAEWVDGCRSRDEPRFKDFEPLEKWVVAQKLSFDWVQLWLYAFDANQRSCESPRRQKNWRVTVLRYLRNGWGPKLWRRDREGGSWVLTDAGVTAALDHDMGHLIGSKADPFEGAQ